MLDELVVFGDDYYLLIYTNKKWTSILHEITKHLYKQRISDFFVLHTTEQHSFFATTGIAILEKGKSLSMQ